MDWTNTSNKSREWETYIQASDLFRLLKKVKNAAWEIDWLPDEILRKINDVTISTSSFIDSLLNIDDFSSDLLSDEENIQRDIEGRYFSVVWKNWTGQLSMYKISKFLDGDTDMIILSFIEFWTFLKLINDIGVPQEITKYESWKILPKLREFFWEISINYICWRWYYIWKLKEEFKDNRKWENSFSYDLLKEDERFDENVLSFHIKVEWKREAGKSSTYQVSSSCFWKTKQWTFSQAQFRVLLRLIKNIWIPQKLATYEVQTILPKLTDILWDTWINKIYWKWSYIWELKEEFKDDKKIEKPDFSYWLLEENEKIDTEVLWVHIKVIGKKTTTSRHYYKVVSTKGSIKKEVILLENGFLTLSRLLNNVWVPQEFSAYQVSHSFLRIKELFWDNILICKIHWKWFYIWEWKTWEAQQDNFKTDLWPSYSASHNPWRAASFTATPIKTIPPTSITNIPWNDSENIKISIPIGFLLDIWNGKMINFQLDYAEWYNYYIIKSQGEIITDPFILQDWDLQILMKIIAWEYQTMNAHIKSRLEQKTPFSIRRWNMGKIELFVKEPISPPLPKVMRIRDWFEVLIWWRRILLENIDNQWIISRKDNPALRTKLSNNGYLTLRTFIDNYDQFIAIEWWSSSVTYLKRRFDHIWLRNVFDSRKASQAHFYKMM